MFIIIIERENSIFLC